MSGFKEPMSDWDRKMFYASPQAGAIQLYELQQEMLRTQSKEQEQIRQMAFIMEQLLAHSLTQAEDLTKQTKSREKLETRRFKINTVLSLIAAISGVLAVIFAIK